MVRYNETLLYNGAYEKIMDRYVTIIPMIFVTFAVAYYLHYLGSNSIQRRGSSHRQICGRPVPLPFSNFS